MAQIKSALKRVKQTETKTMRNKAIKSQVNTSIKKFKVAINLNDAELAGKLLPLAFKEIDSACAKHIIHKNNAARKKAALSKTLNDLKTGKLVITAKVDNKTRAAEKRAKEDLAKQEAAKAAKEAREAAAAKKEAKGKTKETAKKDNAKKETPKAAAKPKKASEDTEAKQPAAKAAKVESAEAKPKTTKAKTAKAIEPEVTEKTE